MSTEFSNVMTPEEVATFTAEIDASKAKTVDLSARLTAALATIKNLEGDLATARAQAATFKKGFESQSRLHADAVAAHARTKGILEATEKKLAEEVTNNADQ